MRLATEAAKAALVLAAAFLAAKLAALFLEPQPPQRPQAVGSGASAKPLSLHYICGSKSLRPQTARPRGSLRGVRLSAVYKDDRGGFVALSTPKGVEFVSLGEEYGGYRLKEITPEEAVFERGGKEVVLRLESGGPSTAAAVSPAAAALAEEGLIKVPRVMVERMRKDVGSLIRQIGLRPVNYHGERAYQVIYLAPGSIFGRMGLRRGDIILAVDGQSVTDPTLMTKLLKPDLERLRITLVRNDEKKDIEYAIE